MARSRTILAETEPAEESPAVTEAPTSFGAEFRELARQRRFVREDASIAPEPAWEPLPTAAPASVEPRQTTSPRISDDQRAVLAELARMSDRLVESREALAAAAARAERAESELAGANQRLMAARALVHDAQHATRMSAERCAWLEGRCETLQEALELAVNASMVTRWKWRRQQRAAMASR